MKTLVATLASLALSLSASAQMPKLPSIEECKTEKGFVFQTDATYGVGFLLPEGWTSKPDCERASGDLPCGFGLRAPGDVKAKVHHVFLQPLRDPFSDAAPAQGFSLRGRRWVLPGGGEGHLLLDPLRQGVWGKTGEAADERLVAIVGDGRRSATLTMIPPLDAEIFAKLARCLQPTANPRR